MEDIKHKSHLNSLSLSLGEGKVDLRSILYSLLAEKWLIISVTAVTLILGIVYVLTFIPQYETRLLMQVEKKQAGEMAMVSFAGLNKTSSAADTQMTLIKSRFILVPAVEKLGLDIGITPHYFPLFGSWYAHHHSSSLAKPLFGASQYAWGGERLQLEHFVSPNEESFKLVAGKNHTYSLFNAAGEKILIGKLGQAASIVSDKFKLSILVKALKANEGTEFIITKRPSESIADNLATQLQISDLGQLYQYEKTGVLQMSLKGSEPQYLVDVLNTVAETAMQKDSERKSIEASKTLEFLEKQLPVVKNSLGKIENTLNLHRKNRGTIDSNIKLKMILKQLTDVQREIEKVNLNRIVLLQQYTLEHPYLIAQKNRKTALEQELRFLEDELQRLPISDQTTAGLIREIKVKSQLYSVLLNKIQELQYIKAGLLSDVRVLNWAHLPNSALPRSKSFTLLASILLGFILGSLIVVLKKALRSYVDSPNWFEHRYGIPNFAILPYSLPQNKNSLAYKENGQNLPLLAESHPADLSIEALRSLRTSLQFALIGAKNNIISIMGISPGIGKSFVAANLAYILADTGKRILLIDGDIRKGYLHHYFKKDRAPGLSQVLQGMVSLEHAIQKTSLPNLHLIASGDLPVNPSELLIGNTLKEVLDALSFQYDLIIIDTAPILAVTDGVILATYASINLLVVANGTHQAEEIELAVKRLQNNNITIQGTIFNNTKITHSAHSRFNYYYAYGETEKEK